VKLLRLIAIVAGTGTLTAGCYSLQPATVATPEPGTRLSFAINDAGRVALGGSMGPELRRVNGSLNSKEGDDYFVNVSGVDLLYGGFQAWAGETVRINSSYVSAIYERKFSPAKTALATAVAIGAITLLVKGPLDHFIAPRDIGEDSMPPTTRRGRIPIRVGPSLPPFLRSINPPRSY
jgi:hypothetical protein